MYTINYGVGEIEVLNINEEDWKNQYCTSNTVAGNSLQIVSNEQDVLYEMQKLFGKMPFMT